MSTLRRTARGLAWAGLIAVGLLAAVILFFVGVTQTPWGRQAILDAARPRLRALFKGDLHIGAIEGSFLRSIELHDVVLDDAHGRPAISAGKVTLRYDLRALFSPQPRIESVVIESGALLIVRDQDGKVNLADLMAPSEGEGASPVLVMGDIQVDSAVHIPQASFHAHCIGRGGLRVGEWIELRQANVELWVRWEETLLRELHGRVVLHGPLHRARARVHLRPDDGTLTGIGTVNLLEASGRMSFRGSALEPAAFLESVPPGRVSLTLSVERGAGHWSARGSATIRALQSHLLSAGTLELSGSVRDFEGTLKGRGKDVVTAGVLLKDMRFEASSRGKKLTIRIDSEGPWQARFLVDVRGELIRRRGRVEGARGKLVTFRLERHGMAWRNRYQAPFLIDKVKPIELGPLTLESGGQEITLALKGRPPRETQLILAGKHLDAARIRRLLLNQTSGISTDVTFFLVGQLRRQRVEGALFGSVGKSPFSVQLILPLGLQPSSSADALVGVNASFDDLLLRQLETEIPPLRPWLASWRSGTVEALIFSHGTMGDPELVGHAQLTLVATSGDARRLSARADISYRNEHARAHLVARAAFPDGLSAEIDAVAQRQTRVRIEGRRLRLYKASKPGALDLILASRVQGKEFMNITGSVNGPLSSIRDAPLELRVAVNRFNLDSVPQLARHFGGTLSLQGEIAGSLRSPHGMVEVLVTELRLGSTLFPSARLDGKVGATGVWLVAEAQQLPDHGVEVEADLPFDARAPLAIFVRAKQWSLDASEKLIPGLRLLRGNVDGELSISGTRELPTAEGRIIVGDGAFAFADSPLEYRNISVAASLHDQELTIDNLEVHAVNGFARLQGHAALVGYLPRAGDLTFESQAFPISVRGISGWLDTKLTAKALPEQGRTKLDVRVHSGRLQLPKLERQRVLQSTGKLEDVVYLDKRAEHKQEKMIDFPLLVDLHLPDAFEVRGPEAEVDLAGSARLELVEKKLKVTGQIEAQRGWVQLLDRRYALERLRVAFEDASHLDPALTIRLTREVTDALLVIEVEGPLSEPSAAMYSEPPVYTEAQVLGMIISGDSQGTQVTDQRLNQQAVGALSSLIVGQIKDRIAPQLPIDIIKIDTATVEGDSTLGGARFEAGTFITQRVYVGYVHRFGAQPVQLRPRNQNEAQIEYRFLRNYRLETRYGDAGVGALTFVWVRRF